MSHSTTQSKAVLVMLATGKQGAAVVHALARANAAAAAANAEHPWLVLAQTRDPGSVKCAPLAALPGVRLLRGTARDPDALFAAAPQPVYAVFSVQLSVDNPRGVTGETAEAKWLADAAARHGVAHFVYSSVNFGGAPGDKTDVPHFESKRLAEEHLKRTHPGLPRTILRPTTFMDQLTLGAPDALLARLSRVLFLTQLKPGRRLQMIACADIGEIAAIVIQNPETYIGRDVDIAGDELSAEELAAGWRDVFGTEMRPRMFAGGAIAWALRVGLAELRAMFKFFNEIGFNVDIPALRATHPGLKDWKTFLSSIKTA